MTDDSQVIRGMILTDAGIVLVERNIKGIVESVFNAPMGTQGMSE